MNIQQAKHIPIVDYLLSLGYQPIKETASAAWYHSPLREDKDPSFKVNILSNLWYDFGLGIGGDIIKLVQQITKDDSITNSLSSIEKRVPGAVKYNSNFNKINNNSPTLNKFAVYPLNNNALIEYIKSRGINTELAKRKCKQVFFENGKKYFAIGFENESNGYELRNKFYKGCIGNKTYSHIKNNSNEVLIFEGFFDFLSYLTLYPDDENIKDFIVLNSVVNAKKIISILQEKYDKIYCYLDNDNAGNECFLSIKNSIKHKEIYDCRIHYKAFKDYNFFLLASKNHI